MDASPKAAAAAAALPSGIAPEAIRDIREFLTLLVRSAKSIGFYKHDPKRYAEFVAPAFKGLEIALGHGAFTLKVTSEGFLCAEQSVWPDSAGTTIPFQFHREGIRLLTFRPGATNAELLAFANCLVAGRSGLGADSAEAKEFVELLWNSNLRHIEHVAVDSFTVGDQDETEVRLEVEKVTKFLRQRLAGRGQTVAGTRLSMADLDLRLEGIDEVRAVVLDAGAASDKFKVKLQERLREDIGRLVFIRLAKVVVDQIRMQALLEPEPLAAPLLDLVDANLLRGDLEALQLLCTGLVEIEKAQAGSAAATVATQLRRRLGKGLAEPFRLEPLTELLETLPQNPQRQVWLQTYLDQLGPDAVSALLGVLERVHATEGRRLLVKVIGRLGAGLEMKLLPGLLSSNAPTVRDTLGILLAGPFTSKAAYISKACANPNPLARAEVMGELGASGKVDLAHKPLLEGTLDAATQVRIAAYRGLVLLSPIRASRDLLRMPKLPAWETRELAEKVAVHACIGQCGTPEALAWLDQLATARKPLFGGRQVVEGWQLAIAGLVEVQSVRSFHRLREMAKLGDASVALEARKAMLELERKLRGKRETDLSHGKAPGVDVADEAFAAFESETAQLRKARQEEQASLAEAAERTRLEEQERARLEAEKLQRRDQAAQAAKVDAAMDEYLAKRGLKPGGGGPTVTSGAHTVRSETVRVTAPRAEGVVPPEARTGTSVTSVTGSPMRMESGIRRVMAHVRADVADGKAVAAAARAQGPLVQSGDSNPRADLASIVPVETDPMELTPGFSEEALDLQIDVEFTPSPPRPKEG